MTNIDSFYSDRKFYADDSFPYGIERSGEFTHQQAALLISHGWAYQALAEGSQEPVTAEEELFVAMCQGKRQAETGHEKAWQRYCSIVSQPKNRIHFPTIQNKPATSFALGGTSSPDFD